MMRATMCLLVGMVSLVAHAQNQKAEMRTIQRIFRDIPYAAVSKAQRLDIYLPEEGDGPFPVILSIHGGAWLAGDKKDGQELPMLQGLNRGYAVVSINYRFSDEAKWPAQICDCKAAVRWIRANAAAYRLHPEKIAAWGSSAGGHLSAMLGTSGGVGFLEDMSLGNSSQSSRVQAVVDWFGPTDFSTMDQQLKESGVEHPMQHSVPDSPESKLLGKDVTDASAPVMDADPGTYVSPGDPPFLIQHGLEDNLVPYQGSILLARKLGKALGYRNVCVELFPATGHGGDAFGTDENLRRVFGFLDTRVKR